MLIYGTWGVGIILNAFAAYRMVSLGLSRHLPPLWFHLAFTSVFAAALFAVRSNRALYLGVYSAGLPLALLFKCAAVTAIYWALTLNYRDFRVAGSVFFGSFSIIGVVAAWLTAFVTPHVFVDSLAKSLWQVALLAERYASVAIVALLLGVLLFLPRNQTMPMPRFALRAAQLMILDSLLAILSAWGQQALAYSHPTATALVATSYGAIAGFAWLFLRGYQEVPVQVLSPEQLDEQRQQLAAKLHVIAAEINCSARSIERD
jgi:hypothetical protein